MGGRTPALLVAAITAWVAAGAHAAPPPGRPKMLVLTDQAGDANALNDQALFVDGPAPEGTKTDPVQVAAADIRSLTFAATGATTVRKVRGKQVGSFQCTGYTATVELGAAPSTSGSFYRVLASTAAHGTFWLQWSNPPNATPSTTLRYTDANTLGFSEIAISPAVATGNKVVFTVTGADLKRAGERLGAMTLTTLRAEVRTDLGRVVLPVWDKLVDSTKQGWPVCPA